MIILKYSLAILCLLLTGCSFFSSQKEKENPALTEYEYTTDDMQSGEESATVLPPCLLYTSPSPRDGLLSRMPSSA